MSLVAVVMDEPTKRREYLRAAFLKHGTDMKEASKAIGRNPTYIQQYIGTENKPPKPRYLSEQNRKALVRAYPFLDEQRLRPPEIPLPEHFGTVATLAESREPEFHGYPVKDLEWRQLRVVWGQMDERFRRAALILIEAAAEISSSKFSQVDNVAHQPGPPNQNEEPSTHRK